MTRFMKPLAFALVLTLCAGGAQAIDVNEIIQLGKSGVQDQVIINLVQNNKLPAPLTTNEVLMLNAAGASSTLMDFLTRPEASRPRSAPSAQMAAVPAATAQGRIVSESLCADPSACADAPTIVEDCYGDPDCGQAVYAQSPAYVDSPVYVTASPTYVAAAPTTYYDYYDSGYDYYDDYPVYYDSGWYGGYYGNYYGGSRPRYGSGYRPHRPSYRPPSSSHRPPAVSPGKPGGPGKPGRPGIGKPGGRSSSAPRIAPGGRNGGSSPRGGGPIRPKLGGSGGGRRGN